jgi:predicted dehydrogenase
MGKMKAGIIGCGKICDIYFKNATKYDVFEIVACADLDMERALAKAEEYGIPKPCTVEQLLNDSEIQLVINLTIPRAHAEICLKSLEAGKHVYVEKPLAVTREEGRSILSLAASKGLLVGSSPDTFLGGGIQTCIKLMNEGKIGTPIAATAFMMSRGHEGWHPSPEFYYQKGGGPMFDMGPYYLTALIALLGPIRRVTGSTSTAFAERMITSQPKAGSIIKVEVPTHVAGLIDFHNGAIGTIITSFDIFGGGANLPRIEIYGTEGTLSVPDPNSFGGVVKLKYKNVKEAIEVELTHGFDKNSRGIGVADMTAAILSGRPHRANGELAYHVLEAMHGFHDASQGGKHYMMESTCRKPEPLPPGLTEQTIY